MITTEAVAMLFGALAKNPTWLVAYAGADQARVDELEEALGLVRRSHAELMQEGIETTMPPVGVMVEVPAAVIDHHKIIAGTLVLIEIDAFEIHC